MPWSCLFYGIPKQSSHMGSHMASQAAPLTFLPALCRAFANYQRDLCKLSAVSISDGTNYCSTFSTSLPLAANSLSSALLQVASSAGCSSDDRQIRPVPTTSSMLPVLPHHDFPHRQQRNSPQGTEVCTGPRTIIPHTKWYALPAQCQRDWDRGLLHVNLNQSDCSRNRQPDLLSEQGAILFVGRGHADPSARDVEFHFLLQTDQSCQPSRAAITTANRHSAMIRFHAKREQRSFDKKVRMARASPIQMSMTIISAL